MLAKEVPSSDRLLACPYSSLSTELYNPRAFVTHAASLRQAFAHCARFPTAASRRSLDCVSVPVWLFILSDQLPVLALVSRYLTNKLMAADSSSGESFHGEALFGRRLCEPVVLCCISFPFGRLSTTRR